MTWTQNPMKTWQMDTKVSHPDWSPDGSQVVFTRINEMPVVIESGVVL